MTQFQELPSLAEVEEDGQATFQVLLNMLNALRQPIEWQIIRNE